jgi:hypothetical protein
MAQEPHVPPGAAPAPVPARPEGFPRYGLSAVHAAALVTATAPAPRSGLTVQPHTGLRRAQGGPWRKALVRYAA